MFAKLKKKIQEEGTSPEGDRSFQGHGPGLASPVSKSPGVPLLGSFRESPGRDSDRESMTASNTSINDIGNRDTSSKEEVMQLLLKRTEQVKKMESKVSELAALVKDRNRTIEKLETTLEKNQDDMAQKIDELDQKHQASKAKMTEGFTLALQKKEEEMKLEIEAVEQTKSELSEKLKDAEKYREKFFKNEEANDEFQGLATQELAKVKHMLLNTQESLSKCQKELEEKTQKLAESTKKAIDLDEEVNSLMQQISQLTSTSERNEEDNMKLKLEISNLQKENQELASQLTQKNTFCTALEKKYTELHEKHQTMEHITEQNKLKVNKLLEEKDEHISHLNERVETLGQRLQNSDLSVDDKVKALETERENLEKKIQETRQQVTEVKSTSNEKVSHLERQISNLNSKMAEDNEELMRHQKVTDEEKAKLHKQIEELNTKIFNAEKEAEKSNELLKEKERLLEKQKQSAAEEMKKSKADMFNLQSELTEKISSLESQLQMIEKAREQDKTQYQNKISHLESNQGDWLGKEIEMEKHTTQLEDSIEKLKNEASQKDKMHAETRKELEAKMRECEELKDKVATLEEDLRTKESQLLETLSKQKVLEKEFQECSAEKDQLLVRNAQLNHQLDTFKHNSILEKQDLEQDLSSKTTAIAGLEASVEDQNKEIKQWKERVDELEKENEQAKGALESAKIDQLQGELTGMEAQLADKNKTIKLQQQRLTDLKKTLQRELKVQSLPNDEPPEGNNVTESVSVSKVAQNNDSKPATPFLQGYTSTIQHADRLLPAQMRADMRQMQISHNANDNGDAVLTPVNFQYLKHVVLKFMLSRESEAIHLIKAISVLLHFSQDEQMLIKETLDWKMSWFGTRPKVGKGQTAKVIPPSY